MDIGTALVAEMVQQNISGDPTALPSMAGVDSTAVSATTGADIRHNRRLGHPTEQVIRRLLTVLESGVNYEGSLSPCETCNIKKSVQQDHPKTVDSFNITSDYN